MTPRRWDRSYESYLDFYRDTYGQHVVASRSAGSFGASVMEAAQSAGDWSDAPTPDLTLAWLGSSAVDLSCDLGAGRFSVTQQPAQAILIAPGAGASVQMAGPHVCRVVAVPYSRLLVLGAEREERLPTDGDFGPLHRRVLSSPRLSQLLEAFWSSEGAASKLRDDGLILQLAATLLSLPDPRPAPKRGGLASWPERRCVEYLRTNLADDVDLPTLAGVANLSPFRFARMFKKSLGVPPHRYQLLLRLERAKALLLSTEMSVLEVALAVGYDAPQTLARLFRREMGVTPSAWRRERRS